MVVIDLVGGSVQAMLADEHNELLLVASLDKVVRIYDIGEACMIWK